MQGRLKQDIDQTIDALEASIRGGENATGKNHASSDGRQKNRVHPATRIAQDYQGHVVKQRIIWVSVGAIVLAIMGMWGWNMRTVFYDASRGKYDVVTPLNSVGTYFNEAMQIAGKQDVQAEESEQARLDTTQQDFSETTSTPIHTVATSTLDTLANSLANHVSSTPTSTSFTTTTP